MEPERRRLAARAACCLAAGLVAGVPAACGGTERAPAPPPATPDHGADEVSSSGTAGLRDQRYRAHRHGERSAGD